LLIHYPKDKSGIKDVTITENTTLTHDFLKRHKILLVEDNELNQLLAVKVLRNGIKKLMLQIMER
jgi:hypothetical protein